MSTPYKRRKRLDAGGNLVFEILPPPTTMQMAANLARHSMEIARSRFELAPPAVQDARLATCRRCEFWDEGARFGLGKCNHPRCGCTKAKILFAASACPIGRW